MNIVEIAGHLGADPEVRFTPSGQKITNMRVATRVRRQGKDETIWWKVTVFGDRFDKMLSYMKKGSAIIVIGEMNPPHMWADKEGKQHVDLEIVAEIIRFSPFGKPDRPEGAQQGAYGQPAQGGAYAPAAYAQPAPARAPQQMHESPAGYSEPSFGSAPSQYENQYQGYQNNHEEEQVPF